jgi:IS5 family transposase
VVRRRHAQRTVFELLLPDGDKLWDPALRGIDEVLDDDDLVEQVARALGRRSPRSFGLGRPGVPAEVALRMLVLKHLYDWSYDECEREVRGGLVYRAFCRIGCERVPDAKTLIRIAQVLGPEDLKAILERLVAVARKKKLTRGLRMRVDTTVVEANIHYPTDSSLLEDGVRVLTRAVKRLSEKAGLGGIRDRTRSVSRRAFEIAHLSRRGMQEKTKLRMRASYQKLLGLTRSVVREAKKAVTEVVSGTPKGTLATQPHIEALTRKITDTVELIDRVVAQTKARVLKGDTHHPDKVLSIFEPQTEGIRKGKAAKPTEFGKLVKIQESEGQFITDYEVCATRVPDQWLWEPSLKAHAQRFGHPPRLAVADSGFASADNERVAEAMGVRRVALPRRGRLSGKVARRQKQRWFRRALRWRTGSEGKISVLKRRHGLSRCRYQGVAGMERWVGFGVIAYDLWVLGHAGAQS